MSAHLSNAINKTTVTCLPDMLLWSCFLVISDNVTTSIVHTPLRSLINNMKADGPNQVPCGIEPLRVNHSDKYSDSLTRCMRLVKKEHNQQINNCGTPELYNIRTKNEVIYVIERHVVKPISITRTDSLLSKAWCQWWKFHNCACC